MFRGSWKIKKKQTNEKNDILFNDFGVNYNNENILFKKGTLILRLKNPKFKNFYDFCNLLYEENNIFAMYHEYVFDVILGQRKNWFWLNFYYIINSIIIIVLLFFFSLYSLKNLIDY